MKAHVCPWWFAYTFDNRFRRLFHRPEEVLGPYVKQGMTVMDVGCGIGFFSIGLARLVGDKGCVLAVDLQQRMLDILERRAKKAGMAGRIKTHRCRPDEIGIDGTVDFALAFWMVHEVPDTDGFFHQISSILRPDAKLLIAEPKFHVSFGHFQEFLSSARRNGLRQYANPSIRLSWSALLDMYSYNS
ncbi:MAG: class I SAM-dependent methyltransferase [Desulfatiglandaceae bacterium]